jgi:methylenetetrahydrofolate dehydrogenase (NADP+)/methenyltetrahydrofolate cyclohydrolase
MRSSGGSRTGTIRKEAVLIDGRKIAGEILEKVRQDVAALSYVPKLVDVVVGSSAVVDQYVGIKRRRSASVGIEFEEKKFPVNISQGQLAAAVRKICREPNVCGVIIQLPLPSTMDKHFVVNAIDPRLDVDAITSGQGVLVSPTAAAVVHMLASINFVVNGKRAVMVGAGDLVGKPVAAQLRAAGASVSVADSSTQNLAELCLGADILVSAAGVPNLITAAMVNEHAVVIDAGTSDTVLGIAGDVDFEHVAPKVAAISPVPGGVGPVAVAMLLANVASVAKVAKV